MLSTTSPILWDASEVLGVSPSDDRTCVGWAPSQGRRCRNPINIANRAEASKLLEEISLLDPESSAVDRKLKKLAPKVLCLRNHQGQAGNMVKIWQQMIETSVSDDEETEQREEAERLAEERREQQRVERRREEERRAREERGEQSRQLERRKAQRREEERQAAIAEADGRLATLYEALDTFRSSVREIASPPATNSEQQEGPVAQPETNVVVVDAATAASPDDIPSQPASPPTSSTSCPPTTHRRPVTGDCEICLLDMLNGEAITWCRAQCGKNFHHDCIQRWVNEEEFTNSCPNCRAQWVKEEDVG